METALAYHLLLFVFGSYVTYVGGELAHPRPHPTANQRARSRHMWRGVADEKAGLGLHLLLQKQADDICADDMEGLASLGVGADPDAFIAKAPALIAGALDQRPLCGVLTAECCHLITSAGRGGAVGEEVQTRWRAALFDAGVLSRLVATMGGRDEAKQGCLRPPRSSPRAFEGVPRLGSAALSWLLDENPVVLPSDSAIKLRYRMRQQAVQDGVLGALVLTLRTACDGPPHDPSGTAGMTYTGICAETFGLACGALDRAVRVTGAKHEAGRKRELLHIDLVMTQPPTNGRRARSARGTRSCVLSCKPRPTRPGPSRRSCEGSRSTPATRTPAGRPATSWTRSRP